MMRRAMAQIGWDVSNGGPRVIGMSDLKGLCYPIGASSARIASGLDGFHFKDDFVARNSSGRPLAKGNVA
ncbi:hypothetical protein RHI9324_03175 [Rhizobium sp. CECT 9324]|jgi:hypothetical protein|nr:hypothetical protein RHI9324_03175 [Rhizobium sp. CECT 9324]